MARGDGLTAVQLTMMALGTVIGGSFFLGSAIGLRSAGPAVLVAYALAGALVYVILFALSELTVADPSPGSFRTYAERAFGRGAGFVVGWVYWTGLVVAMSSEAIAVSVLLRKWFPGLSIPLLGSSVIVGVSMLNLLGATRLSKLESGLAAIKLLALAGFIILSFGIILGLVPGVAPVGPGSLRTEPLAPGGIGGIAGSMLLVMFAYAGFEIIGLAASETSDPHRTVPRAITSTVLALIGLYLLTIVALLPLIPTGLLTTGKSPLVAALERQRLGWAGNAMNVVLVTAILSTMLAAMFGLGRMLRSLADEGHAPPWLGGRGDVPYRGILASGAGMLLALAFGFLLPKEVYLFLVSSGGFALLFSYAVILATHYRLRRRTGCPPKGKCQLPGYPVTSWLALGASVLIIGSMPLVPGQGAGLAAGLFLVVFFSGLYLVTRAVHRRRS